MSLENKVFKYDQKNISVRELQLNDPDILQEMADKLREGKYILPYPKLYTQTTKLSDLFFDIP